MSNSTALLLFLGSLHFSLPAFGSETTEIQIGALKVVLPTTIAITGTEIGLSDRECLFSVVLSARSNEFIPLRGGITVNLRDSIGTTIDNTYYEALVEGINRAEIKGAFRCKNTNATLKPPYAFEISPRNVTGESKTVPVTLNFSKPNPTQSPTPIAKATSAPVPSPTIYVTNPVDESLKQQISRLKNQLDILEKKLRKVCASKPKPKGC